MFSAKFKFYAVFVAAAVHVASVRGQCAYRAILLRRDHSSTVQQLGPHRRHPLPSSDHFQACYLTE